MRWWNKIPANKTDLLKEINRHSEPNKYIYVNVGWTKLNQLRWFGGYEVFRQMFYFDWKWGNNLKKSEGWQAAASETEWKSANIWGLWLSEVLES